MVCRVCSEGTYGRFYMLLPVMKLRGNNFMKTGNCKLSHKIIDRIMHPTVFVEDENGNISEINNIEGHEFNLLFSLSLKQNCFGQVKGIHYKNMKLEIGFRSKQTYYNILNNLQLKGYIRIDNRRNDGYWDCTILNNVFNGEEDYKKGYFNTNRAFLHSPEFRRLSTNEKKLCIKLAMCYQEEHCEKYGLQIYPETMAKWIGLKTTSLIYRYMENISKFFPNERREGIQGELIYFPKGNKVPFTTTNKTEREHYLTHKIKCFCHDFKIAYTLKDLKDLIILMGQYASKGIGKLYGTICDVLISKRSIEPALINSLLSSKVSKGGQASSKTAAKLDRNTLLTFKADWYQQPIYASMFPTIIYD